MFMNERRDDAEQGEEVSDHDDHDKDAEELGGVQPVMNAPLLTQRVGLVAWEKEGPNGHSPQIW